MPFIHCDCTENILWDSSLNNQFALTKSIDVWRVPISVNFKLINRFGSILSEDEHTRASRYHQEKDKHRFMVSRIVLRILLAKYSGNEPSAIKFIVGLNKKPFVQTTGGAGMHYNVSHSGDLILIAVSDSDIGVDVEMIDKDSSYTEILQQNFSQEEIDFIQSGKQPAENFYLLWTRKEALLKATSKGIDSDLPFVPSLNGEHAVDHKIISSENNWVVSSFKVEENYIGSIAYKNNKQSIAFRNIESCSLFL